MTMNISQLMQARYSVRAYLSTAVEEEKLEQILQAGRMAPTAANQQPNRFLVLRTPESLQKLSKAANAHGAPLVILVCADQNTAWTRPFDGHSMVDIDATIATDHMMLCAWDLGIASCWLTYFDPQVLAAQFNLPPHLVPVNLLALGYSADANPPAPQRHQQTRKPLHQLVSYEHF